MTKTKSGKIGRAVKYSSNKGPVYPARGRPKKITHLTSPAVSRTMTNDTTVQKDGHMIVIPAPNLIDKEKLFNGSDNKTPAKSTNLTEEENTPLSTNTMQVVKIVAPVNQDDILKNSENLQKNP